VTNNGNTVLTDEIELKLTPTFSNQQIEIRTFVRAFAGSTQISNTSAGATVTLSEAGVEQSVTMAPLTANLSANIASPNFANHDRFKISFEAREVGTQLGYLAKIDNIVFKFIA
jgi:hypothetical protein